MTAQDSQETVTAGHVIGGSFGMAFVIANTPSLPQMLRTILIVAAVATMVLTVVCFGRGISNGTVVRPENGNESFGRRYWGVVLIEAVALFGGLALLNRWEPSANVAWIALVVGIHFFALAKLWVSGSQEIALIAFAMTALGVIGLAIAFSSDSRDAVAVVAGVGSGAVLLSSSLAGSIRSLPPRSAVRQG
ncbi:MAG: hypothetical protein ABIR57_07770 [Aeromicrobium sp.]